METGVASTKPANVLENDEMKNDLNPVGLQEIEVDIEKKKELSDNTGDTEDEFYSTQEDDDAQKIGVKKDTTIDDIVVNDDCLVEYEDEDQPQESFKKFDDEDLLAEYRTDHIDPNDWNENDNATSFEEKDITNKMKQHDDSPLYQELEAEMPSLDNRMSSSNKKKVDYEVTEFYIPQDHEVYIDEIQIQEGSLEEYAMEMDEIHHGKISHDDKLTSVMDVGSMMDESHKVPPPEPKKQSKSIPSYARPTAISSYRYKLLEDSKAAKVTHDRKPDDKKDNKTRGKVILSHPMPNRNVPGKALTRTTELIEKANANAIYRHSSSKKKNVSFQTKTKT